MDKELCFRLQDKELYLDQVLVDYMDIPIFFICKDKSNQYYVVLCTDIEDLNYIIVHTSIINIYNLLHGKIPMRNIFLKQKDFWKVISGEEVGLDRIRKCSIEQLERSILPEENAFFSILTERISEYVRKFDEDFLREKFVAKSEEKVEFIGVTPDETFDSFVRRIEKYMNLSEYSFKTALKEDRKIDISYDKSMFQCKEKKTVMINSSGLDRWVVNELSNAAT